MNENEDYTNDYQAIKGLKGLQNLGNTCYINATLQALLHIRSLRIYFTETYFRRLRLQWDNSIDCLFHQFMISMWTLPSSSTSNHDHHHHHNNFNNKKFKINNHLNNNNINNSSCLNNNNSNNHQIAQDSSIILRALVSFIWKRYTFFSPGDQHDSQEFLQCFLSDLHESLKTPFYPELQLNQCKSRYFDHRLKTLAKYLIDYQINNSNDGDDDDDDGGGGDFHNFNVHNDQIDYYNHIDQFIQHSKFIDYEIENKQCDSNDLNDHDDLSSKPIFYNFLFNNINPSTTETHHNDQNLKYRSIVSDLFAGELENTIRCTNCGRTSVLNETFLNLSIPITAIDRAIQSKFENSIVFPIRKRVPFSQTNFDNISTTTTISNNSSATQQSLIGRSINFAWETVRHYYDCVWNWFDWLMSFLSTPAVNLMDCLQTFFNAELLENENRYHCENCKKLCNGIKCIRIKKLPEILIVHLNRYQNMNSIVRKITTQLNFPLNDFSLKSFLADSIASCISEKDALYDLVAIVCHNGTQVTNGHYICYALNETNLDWYEYDDIHVSYVNKDRILSMASSAYILFYQRSDQQSLVSKALDVIYDIERRWIETNTDETFLQRMSLNLNDYYFFSNASSFSYRVSHDDAFINLKSFHFSKHWLMAFQSVQNPGPIDNSDIFCSHGLIRPTEYLFFNRLSLPVIEPVGHFLVLLYGGGPLFSRSNILTNVDNSTSMQQQCAVCLQCSSILDLYDDRRKNEFNEFIQLQSSTEINGNMFRKLKLKTSEVTIIFDDKSDSRQCYKVDNIMNNQEEEEEEDLLIVSENNNNNGAIITSVDDNDDEECDDRKSVEPSKMIVDEQSAYYYLISAEWIIKWLSFVNVRFDQSTVTTRDRQLFSLYDQIFKKHEERNQNRQPFDEIYHRPIHLRTKTIHAPLASLLRSIMHTMNKNQFQISAEEMLKQIDLNLHTVSPPGAIDNWSIFGIKRKILSENRNRENSNKESKDKLKMTIDMANKYDDICRLFAEMLSGQSTFNNNNNNFNEDNDDDEDDETIGSKNTNLRCQYKFAFQQRFGGLCEENSCCVFYLVSENYWQIFSRIYGGGPIIRFNYLLNKFEANITVDDIEYFIREHYRSKQTMINSENTVDDHNNDNDLDGINHHHHDDDDPDQDDEDDQNQNEIDNLLIDHNSNTNNNDCCRHRRTNLINVSTSISEDNDDHQSTSTTLLPSSSSSSTSSKLSNIKSNDHNKID